MEKENNELKKENKRLRRGIRRILEVKRLWGSVIDPNYQKMVTEIIGLAKHLLEEQEKGD